MLEIYLSAFYSNNFSTVYCRFHSKKLCDAYPNFIKGALTDFIHDQCTVCKDSWIVFSVPMKGPFSR